MSIKVNNGEQLLRSPIFVEPDLEVKTWGQIKAMIEAQGVKDDDVVFMLDVGPMPKRMYVSRDYVGYLEISDEASFLMRQEP